MCRMREYTDKYCSVCVCLSAFLGDYYRYILSAGMPEWSKGDDLRSSSFALRGFEPHSLHFSHHLWCGSQLLSSNGLGFMSVKHAI